MTTNHHTPISTGAPAEAATFNVPLGELDDAITGNAADIVGHTHAADEIVSGQLALEQGGTESDLSSTGSGALVQTSAGAAVTVETLDETRGGTGQDAYIKGDLLAASSPNVLGKLGVGSDGQVLTADSGQTAGLKWADPAAEAATIQFVIDGGGAALTTGEKGHLAVPFACTITKVQALADQMGSIVVDVWKDTYANFPPDDADSITASAPVTLSTAQKSEDSTLTGWITGLSAGDILAFNVDSATDITRVTIVLFVTKA